MHKRATKIGAPASFNHDRMLPHAHQSEPLLLAQLLSSVTLEASTHANRNDPRHSMRVRLGADKMSQHNPKAFKGSSDVTVSQEPHTGMEPSPEYGNHNLPQVPPTFPIHVIHEKGSQALLKV